MTFSIMCISNSSVWRQWKQQCMSEVPEVCLWCWFFTVNKAATIIQAYWHGYRTRHFNTHVVSIRKEIRARRAEDHILLLRQDLERLVLRWVFRICVIVVWCIQIDKFHELLATLNIWLVLLIGFVRTFSHVSWNNVCSWFIIKYACITS